MNNKIPVGATIAHGYRFVFGNVGTIIKAAWLPLLAQLAVAFLINQRLAVLFAALQAKDPGAVSLFGSLILLIPLSLIFFFAQLTAITQMALGQPPQAWFAFHFGKPMWRLTGGFLSALAIIATLAAMGFLVMLIVMVPFNLTIKTAPDSLLAGAMVAATLTAFLVWLAFAFIRFAFLLAPVNVSEQRWGVLRAWNLSEGNFWRVLLVTLAIVLPGLIIGDALVEVLTKVPIMPLPDKEAAHAFATALRIARFRAITDYWYLVLPLTGVLTLFQLGAGCAAQVFAYRYLTAVSAPVASDALP